MGEEHHAKTTIRNSDWAEVKRSFELWRSSREKVAPYPRLKPFRKYAIGSYPSKTVSRKA